MYAFKWAPKFSTSSSSSRWLRLFVPWINDRSLSSRSSSSCSLWKPYVRENEQYHCSSRFRTDYQHQSKLLRYTWVIHNSRMRHVNHSWSLWPEFQVRWQESASRWSMDLLEEPWSHDDTRQKTIDHWIDTEIDERMRWALPSFGQHRIGQLCELDDEEASLQ